MIAFILADVTLVTMVTPDVLHVSVTSMEHTTSNVFQMMVDVPASPTTWVIIVTSVLMAISVSPTARVRNSRPSTLEVLHDFWCPISHFYPRPVLVFWYCHCWHLSVCLCVCQSRACLLICSLYWSRQPRVFASDMTVTGLEPPVVWCICDVSLLPRTH